jgi:calcineurin-like phosphoesterase family protein
VDFLSADHHLDHVKILEYCSRPFSTIEAMNRAIVERHNAVVGQQDTTYMLGDFALARPDRIQQLLGQMNGRKILIMGNHDHYTLARARSVGFSEVYRRMEIHSRAVRFLLTHESERTPLDVQPLDWVLCGHVHGRWRIKGRRINVGVDVWDFRPVSLDQVCELVHELENYYGTKMA